MQQVTDTHLTPQRRNLDTTSNLDAWNYIPKGWRHVTEAENNDAFRNALSTITRTAPTRDDLLRTFEDTAKAIDEFRGSNGTVVYLTPLTAEQTNKDAAALFNVYADVAIYRDGKWAPMPDSTNGRGSTTRTNKKQN